MYFILYPDQEKLRYCEQFLATELDDAEQGFNMWGTVQV